MLSICLIAKNEENCIVNCLQSLKPLCEAGAEIVVVDTGSTDRTKQIAGLYTDKLYDFTWIDDFAAARNFAASKATNDWIMAIDCDESVLWPKSSSEVSALVSELNALPIDTAGMLTNISKNAQDSNVSDHLARIYNKTVYQYKGIIHEQLFMRNGGAPHYKLLSLTLRHDGYEDPARMQEKAARNLTLLLKEYDRNPNDDYTLFQIAQSYRALTKYEQALIYFEKALALDINPELDYVKTLVESYGYTLIDLGRADEALSLYGVYDTFSTRADFVFMLGIANMKSGNITKAIEEFKKAVTISGHCIQGTNSYLAYYNLGVIYECMGDTKTAKDYYLTCADYTPAKIRLTALS